MSSEFLDGIHLDADDRSLSIVFDGPYDALVSGSSGGLHGGIRGINIGGPSKEGFLNIDCNCDAYGCTMDGRNVTNVLSIAVRCGEPTVWRVDGMTVPESTGEVLLILITDVDLADHTMARAMITMTESMTAALQDMGIRTDDLEVPSGPTSVRTVVVRNPSGKIRLQNAGKHSVFGELIGRSCKESFRKVIGIPVCTMSPYDAASTFIEDAIEWGLVPEDIGNDILESMRN